MLKLCAIGYNLTQLGSLPAHHHTNIPGVVFVLFTYVVTSPQHFGRCTLSYRNGYLASSPMPDFRFRSPSARCAARGHTFFSRWPLRRRGVNVSTRKHRQYHRVIQRFFVTVFPILDHLQPRWPRIFYDHADRTADYVIRSCQTISNRDVSTPAPFMLP